MSDDWKVGDLAVCVDDGPCRCGCGAPVSVSTGKIYRVEALENWGDIYLILEGVYPVNAHARGTKCDRFRKILPDEPIACETEFRILLDLSKKRVKA